MEELARKQSQLLGISLSEYIVEALATKIASEEVAFWGQLAKMDILRRLAIDKAVDLFLINPAALSVNYSRAEAEEYVLASGAWYKYFDFKGLAYDAPPFTTEEEFEAIALRRIGALKT